MLKYDYKEVQIASHFDSHYAYGATTVSFHEVCLLQVRIRFFGDMGLPALSSIVTNVYRYTQMMRACLGDYWERIPMPTLAIVVRKSLFSLCILQNKMIW